MVLLFKDGYWFHMNNLNSPENREIIESVLKEETGRALKIHCVMEEAWGSGTSPDGEEIRIKEFFKGMEDRIEIKD